MIDLADSSVDLKEVWPASRVARNFVLGVQCGVHRWRDLRDYETPYGPADGFVYFISVGSSEKIQYVKIGFTGKSPIARMADLQTGCPVSMQMLGFVMGRLSLEQDLHLVLKDDRACGEWFRYSEFAHRVVRGQLDKPSL